MDIEVDLGELAAAAAGLRAAGGAVKEMGPLPSGAASSSGPSLASALTMAAEAWSTAARSLRDAVIADADRIVACGRAYQQTDEAVQERFAAMASPLGRKIPQ